jgi:hypothetical protein
MFPTLVTRYSTVREDIGLNPKAPASGFNIAKQDVAIAGLVFTKPGRH